MASELATYELFIDDGRIVSERSTQGAWMNAHDVEAAIAALESERDQWKARAEKAEAIVAECRAANFIDDQGVVRKVGIERFTPGDEVVGFGFIHIEAMSDTHFWMDLAGSHFHIFAKNQKSHLDFTCPDGIEQAAEQAREGGKHG